MKTISSVENLVYRVKRKDTLAMKLLYERFAKNMLTTSYRLTKNLADSEDILQDAFLKSFEQIHKLKQPAQYGTWLKRIVVNSSLDHIKQRIRFDHLDTFEDNSQNIEEHWYTGISFAQIKIAINQLPDGCRQIFSLYLLENYKHREIAELLDISISTSKSQYSYALKLLQTNLLKLKQ